MTPLVFLDCETDGLHPGRRVWEIAMIRRDDMGERERHFFVALDLRNSDPFGLKVGGFWDRHPAGRKLSGKPALPGPSVLCKHDAAREVMEWTFDAHLVGVNPAFDADTLAGLMRHEGYLPSWHYHLVDLIAMSVGYLNAIPMTVKLGAATETIESLSWIGSSAQILTIPSEALERGADDGLQPPWKSDDLARACGVEPPTGGERHTAVGDARWAARWYDAITGGAR